MYAILGTVSVNTVIILIQVIPSIGLLTVDPKDRLKMSDLRNNEWVQGYSATLQPSTLLIIPDILAHSAETGIQQTISALHQADQEGFRVQVSSVISYACFILTCKVIL